MRARDNPFRAERVEALGLRLSEGEWALIEARWQANHRRGAIVGPEGTGKTTLLDEWQRRLTRKGLPCFRRTLRRGESWWPARDVKAGTVLLLDGAEQLSGLAWWHLRWRCRRAAGVVVTSHRPGFLATLWEARTTPRLLADLVTELAGDADPEACVTLHGRHGGNLRLALRELYDGDGKSR